MSSTNLFALAQQLHQEGDLQQAEGLYRQIIEADSSHAGAYLFLGLLTHKAGRHEDGIELIRHALALQPADPAFHYNLGFILAEEGRKEEAAECFRRAIALRPRYAKAHANLGLVLMGLLRLDEAAEHHEQALRLEPDVAVYRWNRSLLWLLQGDFARGWADYEYRWGRPGMAERSWARPRWDGAPLCGRSVLLYAEQGYGDTIQFIRYASLVKERGGRVIFECQPPLVPLLREVPGVEHLVPAGYPLPDFVVQAPLLSVPGIIGTTLENIPAKVPYLRADASLTDYWRRELAPLDGLKIGIAWQGYPRFWADRERSIPLYFFETLARVPGVRLVSLQKGPGSEQLTSCASALAAPGRFPVLDFGDRLDASGAFLDTAAIMMSLDLIITSDTAIPHLAGALGVPVWTIVPFVPDWRWLLARTDSPWYPTMRLFRQCRAGDWAEVFERVAAELACLRADRTSRSKGNML
ncbi:MAG TPA: tetratricopeptide repeat-containing glycosyltransferase family protein [Gemmataceae bacterium]|nr:tetratricopeptide repeat-containing glycosyltransferase family protein [Gemmataceae bacterium]